MSDDAVELTWRQVLTETAAQLGDRSHAKWMCEVASGADADDFLVELDEHPTERMIAHLDAMIGRYDAGEPLQYVLGRWGFRRLDLAVDQRVLIPRADTELLVEVAVEKVAHRVPRRIADLGTGSGAVGLALADELPLDQTEIWLTDVDTAALDVARANLAGIGRNARNVRIGHGDWFDALPADEPFDVIVSNPPYIAVGDPELEGLVAEWEPTSALLSGSDGLDALRAITSGAGVHLVGGGWLAVEHGHRQGAAVRRLFVEAAFEMVETRTDLAGAERVTLGVKP